MAFVIDYFSYIEVPHFLDEIKMSQLSDKLMEGFFGKLTERTFGKSLRIGDMAKRINQLRWSRPASEETWMYMVDEIEDDQGILWMLFDIRHEQLFTIIDL